jgi:hypothetical protein
MPTFGFAGSATPGFPCESWAYQSLVTSVGLPCSLTMSRTTRASMPSAIIFVLLVTLITLRFTDPSEESTTR